jgi:hypothetical protein
LNSRRFAAALILAFGARWVQYRPATYVLACLFVTRSVPERSIQDTHRDQVVRYLRSIYARKFN